MKKISYILIAIGLVMIVVVMNKACKPAQSKGFKEQSFAHEVRSVELIDGIQKITYKDHSSMSFSGLNFANEQMNQYQEMEFSEFIHPGDSIFKEAGKLILLIKPTDGKPFELDIN